MTSAQIFSLIVVAAGGFYFWRSYAAINEVYAQKIEILDAIKRISNQFERLDLLKDERRVSWKSHYHSVFWFKDPWRLYPDSIRALMDRHDA